MLKRKQLYFTAPRTVEVREEDLSAPGQGEVIVESILSAISPGTEMLVYRGQFPDMPVDANIQSLNGCFAYPMPYGYACVGRVVELGRDVPSEWQDKLVFSFQPHSSHFVTSPDALLLVPDQLSAESACFLPNTETAVNLVQDAAPILGERALVLGQGIVGLLTASLLVEFPLESLVCADMHLLRRRAALNLGATAALDPASSAFLEVARSFLKTGADLTLELSGSPAALNSAIALTVFSGRVLIGSWYSGKNIQVDLGGTFHRSRLRLISSQVSTIAPELSGRWDKARRFEVAWYVINRLHPEKWITHRYKIDDASQAYRLIDERPGEAIQVILQYN